MIPVAYPYGIAGIPSGYGTEQHLAARIARMLKLDRLRVSLTKNGYLKIAELVEKFPREQILDNLDGKVRGVRLVDSQVANILSRDDVTHEIPGFWDGIRQHDKDAIRSFVMLAVIFSHHKLITLFRTTSQGKMCGCITRDDLTPKEYTNLSYAMAEAGLCPPSRNEQSFNYDLSPIVKNLENAGSLVRRLIESKLGRCGWLDPTRVDYSTDGEFYSACRAAGMIGALGITQAAFKAWLEGG
jgi:hypothetical protein